MAIPTPYSYRQYQGNGAATDFSVPFPYLERGHVHLFLGSRELTAGTEYSWTSGSQVKVTTAPALGETLTVRRLTPEDDQIVQWKDGSYIVQGDLNESDRQWLYVLQEHHDQIMLLEWAVGTIPGGGSPAISQAFWSRLARNADAGKGTPSEVAQTVDSKDQKAGDWAADDKHVATTGALSERFDVIMSETTPPSPLPSEIRQPGKLWVNTLTLAVSYWDPNAKAWINTIGTGPVGPQGPVGAQGPIGPAGPQGAAGVQGPAGPTGPQGIQGPSGLGLNYKGTVASSAALPGGAAVNDAYLALDTGNTWVWSPASRWIDIGKLVGPQGPQGIQGIPGTAGAPGADGAQGPKGDTGATGPKGDTGPAGPIGPTGVQGPKGDTGNTGPQGIQGVPGPTGPEGPLPDPSAYARLDAAQSFTKAQRGAPVALTDAATIAVDLALGNNFTVTLAGNRTLGAPTNPVAGQSGVIRVQQDTGGSKTLGYNAIWKFPGGTAPTLTTAANAVDLLAYYVESATRITVRFIGDVK